MKQSIFRFLSSMPHFSFLTKDEMEAVVSASKLVKLPKGHLVAEQGKTSIEDVLVIMRGQLSLYQEEKGERELAGYIKQGEVFGGITVMLNAGISLRTAKVDSEVHCISIPHTVVMDACTQNKAFYEYFLANFSHNIFDKSLDAITRVVQARLFLSGIDPFSFLPDD